MAEWGASPVYMFYGARPVDASPKTLPFDYAGTAYPQSYGGVIGWFVGSPYPTWSGGVATIPLSTHTLAAGDVITISGASNTAYNGTWMVQSATPPQATTYPFDPVQKITINMSADPGDWPYASSAQVSCDKRYWADAVGVPSPYLQDSWSNYPGPYPGNYPNRTPDLTTWTYSYGDYSTQFGYPQWDVYVAVVPHTGSGSLARGGIVSCPDYLLQDKYYIVATLDIPGGIWGVEVDLTRPWLDDMHLDGLELPWIAWGAGGAGWNSQYVANNYAPSDFAWAGSTVTLNRISKPAYTYHA